MKAEKIKHQDPPLPPGYRLFTNPQEYVLGMQLKMLIGAPTGPKWLDVTCVSPHLIGHYLEPKAVQLAIDMGIISYLELTNDMFTGEGKWWELGKGVDVMLKRQPKSPWLFEQLCYCYYNIDITKFRTSNHPQFKSK